MKFYLVIINERFQEHEHPHQRIVRCKDYSQVPNKRGMRIIGGGLEMARYNNNWGVGTIGGGGCSEKLKTVIFLAKHVSFIYLCEQ